MSTPQYGYRPLNDTVPFSIRDSYTFLERLNEALQGFELITEAQEAFKSAVNDALEGGRLATDAFMAEYETKWQDTLSQLIGYTITLSDELYTASMQDGSEFTAYTKTGVDNKVAALEQDVDTAIDDLNTSNAAFQTNVTEQVTQLNVDVAQDIQDLHTAVDGKLDTLFAAEHNVREYGAVGDGVADDTAAIQAALDAARSGDSVIIPTGVYKTTDQLQHPATLDNSRVLITGGGTIKPQGMIGKTALSLSSDFTVVDGIVIDGINGCSHGIYTSGTQTVIRNCKVSNLTATETSSRGIWASTYRGVTIVDNQVMNINAAGDGVLGNDNGASRGIVLNIPQATPTFPSLIADNYVSNIVGEEGDAIHVINTSVKPVYGRGDCIVKGNRVRGWNKRAIKVQAGYVRVEGNDLYSDTPTSATGTGAHHGIEAIQSEFVDIVDNLIAGAPFEGIRIVGNTATTIYGCTIVGNRIEGNTSQRAIYVLHNDRVLIADNTINDGTHGIELVRSSDVTISRNSFYTPNADERVNPVIQVDFDSLRVRIEHNKFHGWRTSGGNVITISGADASVYGNYDTTFQTNAFLWVNSSTASGLFVDQNRSTSNRLIDTSDGSFTDMMRGSNAGKIEANKVLFADAIPTTSMPNIRFNRGDIVYNIASSNATTTGWKCTANGTPGIWVTL